jgi:hypothetical protein
MNTIDQAKDKVLHEPSAAEWAATLRDLIRTIERYRESSEPSSSTHLEQARGELRRFVKAMGARRNTELLKSYEALVLGGAKAIRPFVADDDEAQVMGKLPSLATSVFSRIGRHSTGRDDVARAEILLEELSEAIPSAERGFVAAPNTFSELRRACAKKKLSLASLAKKTGFRPGEISIVLGLPDHFPQIIEAISRELGVQ